MKLNLTLVRRVALFLGVAMAISTVSATDVPKNLGNDLDKLVESNIAIKKAAQTNAKIPLYNGFASERAALASDMAIKEASTNKYLVDIHPSGRMSYDALKEDLLRSCPSLRITAQDTKYRGVGVIEGFISINEVPRVANNKGVTSVQLGIKPYLKGAKGQPSSPEAIQLTLVGTAFDQGVTQHRVDKVSTIYDPGASMSLDGNGISVGCISNSYNAAAGAPADVAAFDLPGAAGNPYNTTAVFVINDDPGVGGVRDEARALCQVVYKMAPRAKLGAGTADFGEVNFANVIRGLAGINSADFPNASTQGFAANVITDDVGYFDEPWYQDGIIGAGVNDVAAAGVHYFSSASNNIGTNGYTSSLRWVANGTGVTFAGGNVALANTNIDLTGVPTELYAGGFHNFNPVPGSLDVAQTWALPSGGQTFVIQWDDPYDQNTMAILDMPALYHNTGNHTGTTITFTDIPALTAGELYECDVNATGGSNFDAIVTIIGPGGTIVDHQDTTIDEVVRFFAPTTGAGYSIAIDRFSTTTGTFSVNLYHASGFVGGPKVTTDINVLAFNSSGAYVPASSFTSNNFATNQPIELAQVVRAGQGLQLVVARRNVPASGGPQHIRIEDGGNGVGGIAPEEYFTYNTVTTGGHDSAQGASGVAAYSVFRPSRPETFTSPGPSVYYFDNMSNRLATPEVRLQPRVAAADGANTSFFVTDSTSDVDTRPNFFGTSAAAPHAAACAALVLQAKGGPGSVTPAQMKNLLQNSTFQHDLDPMFVRGTATASNGGTVTITLNSDASNIVPIFGLTSGVGLQDRNSWKVSYSGPGFLTDLTFNPAGTAATAGSPTSGNNGVDASNNYFRAYFPGVVFLPATLAFTTGTLTGLAAGDISAPVFSNLAPPPSNGTNQWWTMALAFPNSNFTTGKAFTFTVGRGQQHNSVLPNGGANGQDASADLLGGAWEIPENALPPTGGMAFSGHINDGGSLVFSGTMTNTIGSGYSVLDGYGFINVEAAATASTTIPPAVPLTSVVSRRTHGAAGTFDITLPGVECRDSAGGNYTMVFTFGNTITKASAATVSEGSGSVSSLSIAGNQVTVNLTNVQNAQRVTVNVLDIHDSAGNVSAVHSGTMRLLIGDTSANGTCNASDVSQTKAQTGALVGLGNFREDVTANGTINAGDVSDVKAHTGTSVP